MTLKRPGNIEVASGVFLMQSLLDGDSTDGHSFILDNGTSLSLWGKTSSFPWPIAVPAAATVSAGSGTSRQTNILGKPLTVGRKLTLMPDAANRFLTVSGGLDGAGELAKTGPGTLYVTGVVDRTIGKFTVSAGAAVLENAGTFSVTNWTVGTAGYIPDTAAGNVAGPWSGVPRLAVTGDTLFTMPKSADKVTADAEKHHLFIGGEADNFGILDISSGATVSNDLNVARKAGSVGAVYVNDGGKLYWRGGDSNQGWLGYAGVGFLAVNAGGEFASEGMITIGRTGAASGAGGVGIVHQRGGRVTMTKGGSSTLYSFRLGRESNAYGHWYQTGGTSSFASHIALTYADTLLDQANAEAVVTLAGAGTSMSLGDERFLQSCVSTKGATGVVNLNDGATLQVRRIFKNYASTAESDATTKRFLEEAVRTSVASSKFYVNFDGGILKPLNYGTLFNNRGGVYDDPDRVTVYDGGATVDTSLVAAGTKVILWSAPIRKPSGNVLLFVSLPTDAAWVNKYIAPPRVVISGVNAHGATAVAEIDEAAQRLTGITVTSPGNDVPSDITVTLASGDLKSTFACPFTVGAPATDGGLTKRGDNTLELNMAASSPNTYEGPTVVEAGTLKFTYNTYPSASPLVLKGGTVDFVGIARTLPSVEGYGAVTGSGGVTVTGELRLSCADLFDEDRLLTVQKMRIADGVRLVVTDPENLAAHRGAGLRPFLTAAVSLDGALPTVTFADWRCVKSGNTLKFGLPDGTMLLFR